MTLDYAAEDLRERVKALHRGGVDVVYDPVGGSSRSPRSATAGAAGTSWSASRRGDPAHPAQPGAAQGLSIVGVFWGVGRAASPNNRAHAT